MASKLLVTGAAGKLGRSVIRHLIDDQKIAASDIIAVTRDPAKLTELAATGVLVRKGDFDDAASLKSAFAGASRILIVSTDALGEPGKRLRQHLAAIAAAKAAKPVRILYTSMPNPEPGSPIVFAGDHLGSEQALKATGIPYTILRCSWYMENLFMALPQVVSSGKWFTSTGDGRVAHIARDDIAAAAAAALANEAGESRTLTLTGTKALTTGEIAALASKAAGKPIEVVQLSDEQLAAGMKAAGVPDFLAPLLVSFDANTRAGRINLVTGDAEALSGRKPRGLGEFLAANKLAFAA